MCRFCGTGCGVMVGMTDGRVVDVRGDELAHNKGVICIKGSMLPELTRIPGRLTSPKIRKDGRLVDASWDEAMSLVGSRFSDSIRQFGRDSVAFYGSGQLFTEESYTANKLFKAGIGTNNVDGNPRLCMASAASGYIATYGKDEPPGCYADADFAHVFFIIGANPYECHQPIFERIRQRKRLHPETVIVCVDPRRTKTAEHSDIHLPVVPGTDLLLLNAMASVIFEESLQDQGFIDKHVRFSDGEQDVDQAAFRQFLQAYAPEKVEQELGVSATDIRRVAFLFARSPATMSLWTMGMNQRVQGVFLNSMLNGLHLVTGQIGRPGATPFSLTGQPNACGGVRDTGALSHALPGGRLVANPDHRREMEQIWGVPAGTISDKPGFDAVNLFRAMEDGRVKAALIMCTNPGASLPAAGRYHAAMEKCFTVVSDVVEDSETQRHAQVVLPAALWIEKEGVTGQGERRYQLTPKLLDPPGQARSDLAILVDLADRLGHGNADHRPHAASGLGRVARSIDPQPLQLQGHHLRPAGEGAGAAVALPDGRSPGHGAPVCRGRRSVRQQGGGDRVLRQPRQESGGLSPALPAVTRKDDRGVSAVSDHRPRAGAVSHRHDDGPDCRTAPGDRRRDVRAESRGRAEAGCAVRRSHRSADPVRRRHRPGSPDGRLPARRGVRRVLRCEAARSIAWSPTTTIRCRKSRSTR